MNFTNYYTTPATADKSVLLPRATRLVGIIAENASSATRWVHVYDSTTAPTTGAVPVLRVKLAAGEQRAIQLASVGVLCLGNGLCVALSSTGPTYMDPAASEAFFTINWI